MCRAIYAATVAITFFFPYPSWSQTVDPANGTTLIDGTVGAGTSGVDQTLNNRSPNAASDLGTSNPAASGTAANPTLGTDRGVFDSERISPQNQATTAAALDGTALGNDPALRAAAPLDGTITSANDWRMVRHNGRWWYWTPNRTWLYRNGEQWVAYVPRGGPRYNDSAAVDHTQRYQAGYRGDPQMQGETGLRTGVGQSQVETQTDIRPGLGTNANTPVFESTRPIAPTANELQGFYQMQGIRAAPYGGTTGGAMNPTPLGGGSTRSGTGVTGPATFGTPQTNAPSASPITNSPGNPGAIGSPGNPAASGASGTGASASGTTPAGGTGGATGTSGAGTSGASGAGT